MKSKSYQDVMQAIRDGQDEDTIEAMIFDEKACLTDTQMADLRAELQQREIFAEKDRLFAERQASGEWPIKTCEDCKSGACCMRTWHHVGDCCVHCGLDERNLSRHHDVCTFCGFLRKAHGVNVRACSNFTK